MLSCDGVHVPDMWSEVARQPSPQCAEKASFTDTVGSPQIKTPLRLSTQKMSHNQPIRESYIAQRPRCGQAGLSCVYVYVYYINQLIRASAAHGGL